MGAGAASEAAAMGAGAASEEAATGAGAASEEAATGAGAASEAAAMGAGAAAGGGELARLAAKSVQVRNILASLGTKLDRQHACHRAAQWRTGNRRELAPPADALRVALMMLARRGRLEIGGVLKVLAPN